MHDALRKLFVELMTGAPLLDVISASESTHVRKGVVNLYPCPYPQHVCTVTYGINHSTARKTLERATRLMRVVTVHDVQPVVDDGSSTTPDQVESFSDEVSEIFSARH
jgi:folate-dependent phosphoribosylglycinamide formyltransferase PurN